MVAAAAGALERAAAGAETEAPSLRLEVSETAAPIPSLEVIPGSIDWSRSPFTTTPRPAPRPRTSNPVWRDWRRPWPRSLSCLHL